MNDEVAIENFSRKYLVKKRLVQQYVDHLLELERKRNKRKELEENQKYFADYNWEAIYREGTLKKLKVKVLDLYIIEEKLKRSREALKKEKIDLVTIDIAKKMIEGSKVLDESDCDDDVDDDDVDKDDIEDGNDENVLVMTSKGILMRTKRKTNRSRRKIILRIFHRPCDMAELAGLGGVEQELRTFLE